MTHKEGMLEVEYHLDTAMTACPRCRGSVVPQRTLDGVELSCLMCGFVVAEAPYRGRYERITAVAEAVTLGSQTVDSGGIVGGAT